MNYTTIRISSDKEKFYEFTDLVRLKLTEIAQKRSGIVHLFIMHTSAALTITESYDPNVVKDLSNFLKDLVPDDLPYITHKDEGVDDCPSHIKSLLLNQNLSLIVEKGELILGKWQGIFLAEFRREKKEREVYLKFVPDP